MSRRRVLTVVRIVLGALLLQFGASRLSNLPYHVAVFESHPGWQSWPLVGNLRPMALALWIGAGGFAAGMFLVGGLLTRVAALVSLLIALFGLLALSSLGLAANLAHAALAAASLAILVLGGGAGTMDALLGSMQRRSIEREAEREAARQTEQAARLHGDGGATALPR